MTTRNAASANSPGKVVRLVGLDGRLRLQDERSGGPPRGDVIAGSRPHIHFTAGNGWIDDSFGITWHGHADQLFSQHVPDSTVWALGSHGRARRY